MGVGARRYPSDDPDVDAALDIVVYPTADMTWEM